MLRIAALVAVLALAPGAVAGTWYVDVNGIPPGAGTPAAPYTSIDYALAQPTTVSGDLVLVAPGTYAENVVFPAKGVAVISTGGPSVTVIDAVGDGSAVAFLSTDGTTMMLAGFTVTGGSGTMPGALRLGGGIYAKDARYDVTDCILTGNDAYWGGGLYAEDSVGVIAVTTATLNTGTGSQCSGAGMAVNGGMATLTRVDYMDNVAGDPILPGRGGGLAILNAGIVYATDCEFVDNRAELGGGGVHGTGVFEGCLFSGNLGQFGGGIEIPFGPPAEISGCTFELNLADSTSGSANFGGAIWGASLVTRCVIRDNTAYGIGGGVVGATVQDSLLEGNHVGAMDSFSNRGGAAHQSTLIDCTVRGNDVAGGSFFPVVGGGLSGCAARWCDIYDNAAIGDPVSSGGGGADSSDLSGCKVFDNATNGAGGGVRAGTTFRCEVFGNSGNWGGGSADTYLERTTVYGNTASSGLGGGLYVTTSAGAKDSILWNNGSEVHVEAGASADVTYTDVEGGFAGTGNIGDDPLFWNASIGDFMLKPGSPCIDAGDPTSRLDPGGSIADMGAHPFDPGHVGF